ncbi:MAG TPA: PfkB family carbohydrate kinase, partial [Methylomirabilota bacterium]|nr:PfkB family carbohydrate kinase [Methylomirabilota bacterium]
LITTKGEDGSIIGGNNVSTPIEIAVAKADKIVDPTGAGDAYRAGFLYGYLRKWDLKACGQLGATVASFVLEKSGPQTELSKSAIVKRYKETFNEAIDL